MSVPFYYNHGPQASAEMKRDLKRVRAKRPERYLERKAKEQRFDADGKQTTITVTVPAQAQPMSGKERHKFCDQAQGESFMFYREREE